MTRRHRFAITAFALFAVGALARPAEAKGTFFLVELNSGVSESPYRGGAPVLDNGASAGLTLRIPRTNLRYHLLGSLVYRGATVSGRSDGLAYTADRSDLDLYSAHRLVVPIYRMIRAYAEVGLGTRFSTTYLRRDGVGGLSEAQERFLFLTALGVQARVSKHFSLGLRGELQPGGGGQDVAAFATGRATTRNRLALVAQVGVHF